MAEALGRKATAKEEAAKWLLRTFELKLVCVTEGMNGSFWWRRIARTNIRAFLRKWRIPWELVTRSRLRWCITVCGARAWK